MTRHSTIWTIGIAVLLLSVGPIGAQRRGRGGGGPTDLGSPPLAKDAAEQKILDVAQGVPRRMNVPETDGRLIRILTESIGAKRAVEVGTSTGYSGLFFAMALRKTGGKLTTLEIDPDIAAGARKTFEKAGVGDIIDVVVGDAHETVKNVPDGIDIVFIDADKPGYKDYLDKLLPKVRPGGLILAHNISYASQNPEYVQAVVSNPDLETMLISRQMAVTLKKR